MKLPTKAAGPLRRDPKLMVLFGPTKVGKTTMIAQLPEGKYLLIDTEEGSDFLTANRIQVNSIAELLSVIQELTANIADYPYEFIALDTIDLVIEWVEAFIMKKEGVTMIKDIPYGGGYSQVRERVMEIIDRLTRLNKKIILIGHRKKTSSSETDTNEFSVATLDISGKLKNFICADADAIGHVYRDEQGTLMVSFKPSDLVEAGARPGHLKAKTFPFQWEYIYVDTYKSEGFKEPEKIDVLDTKSTEAAA